MNLFLAGFSHLEPLFVVAAKQNNKKVLLQSQMDGKRERVKKSLELLSFWHEKATEYEVEQEAVFFERCDCLPSCSPSYTPTFAIATVIYVVYNLPKTKVVYKILGLIGTVISHFWIIHYLTESFFVPSVFRFFKVIRVFGKHFFHGSQIFSKLHTNNSINSFTKCLVNVLKFTKYLVNVHKIS